MMRTKEEREEFDKIYNDPEKRKDLKIMMRWTYAFLIWFVLCMTSLFFMSWNISIGVWLLGIGMTMLINKKRYKEWYIRMYGIDKWESN